MQKGPNLIFADFEKINHFAKFLVSFQSKKGPISTSSILAVI